MGYYYFENLKQSLSKPEAAQEGLKALIDDTGLFLGVLRVKFEARNPDLMEQAAQELRELKNLIG